MNNGYIEILAHDFSGSRKSGWVYEHRLVAAKKIGRPLLTSEIVHHIDEVRTNNSPENLMVFKSHADHSRFHRTGVAVPVGDGTYFSPKICKKCKRCGRDCKQSFCSHDCAMLSKRVVQRPSREELIQMLQGNTYTAVGRKFGVSDNAIRKWLKA